MKVSDGLNHHCLLETITDDELGNAIGPLLGSQVKIEFSPLTNRSVSPWCARL